MPNSIRLRNYVTPFSPFKSPLQRRLATLITAARKTSHLVGHAGLKNLTNQMRVFPEISHLLQLELLSNGMACDLRHCTEFRSFWLRVRGTITIKVPYLMHQAL
jgi:hypothetical protein